MHKTPVQCEVPLTDAEIKKRIEGEEKGGGGRAAGGFSGFLLMCLRVRAGVAYPDAQEMFSMGSLPGMPQRCGVRSGAGAGMGVAGALPQSAMAGQQQLPPSMQQSAPLPLMPHQVSSPQGPINTSAACAPRA